MRSGERVEGGMWEVEVKGWEEEGWCGGGWIWIEVKECGGGRMWRWEDVEAGGCGDGGDVGEAIEESRFFIRQIHTHTLKTYIHTHTHTTHTHHHSCFPCQAPLSHSILLGICIQDGFQNGADSHFFRRQLCGAEGEMNVVRIVID